MFDSCLGLLCIVFLILLALNLIVILAQMYGTGTQSTSVHQQQGERASHCVACGRRLEPADTQCRTCGLDPHGKRAQDLHDLEVTARTVQQLVDRRQLAPGMGDEVRKPIENRRGELVLTTTRQNAAQRMEAWFGNDLGEAMSVADKQQALALARTLGVAELRVLRALSARALAGLARLWTSLGMLRRACEVYRVLYELHSETPICTTEWDTALQTARLGNDKQLVKMLTPSVAPVEEVPPTPAPVPVPTPPAQVSETTDGADESPESVAPVVPRRSFAEWIAVFMEDRNILWGELIGGTLIIGCSIALVISLWQTLAEIQYFPFLILAAITGALFGAGFYTLHHWKLESTSRGLLLIAMLLVPLDFMVLAGLTRFEQVGVLNWLMAAGALCVFGFLVHRSSRILVETPLDLAVSSAWLVTFATLICAAAQCLAPVWMGHEHSGESAPYALSMAVVLAQGIGIGWMLLRLAAVDSWSLNRLVALLIALGTTTFATCVVLSFLIYAADDLAQVLVVLSPALTLFGAPVVFAGTLVYRKLERANLEQFAIWRTLGTGIALLGGFVMFGGFTAAVDSPVHRWLSGLGNIATLLAAAWFLRVPVLHVPVQAYLAIMLVLGGRFDLGASLAQSSTALRLSGLFVLQALVAEGMVRCQRRLDSHFFAVGGGVSTVLALILILGHASVLPDTTAIVLGLAALTWFAANMRWRLTGLTYASSVVLAEAIFFTFRHTTQLSIIEQWMWSLLVHATICVVANVLSRGIPIDWVHASFRVPLGIASLFASFSAALLLGVKQFDTTFSASMSSMVCLWLAALWLTMAVLKNWPVLFACFQVALSFSWLFVAADLLTDRGWDWREPISLQVYALGLAMLSLTWEWIRMQVSARPGSVLSPPFVPLDRVLSACLLIGQYVLLALLVLWSVGLELSRSADAWRVFPEAWHRSAYSIWAWLVPVVLAGVLVLWLRDCELRLPILGLVFLMLTMPLLVAGRWFHNTKSAASALRWGLAACYGLGSVLVWFCERLGKRRTALVPTRAIRTMLLLGALMPVLAITLDVVVQKLSGASLPGPEEATVFVAMGGPASLIVPLGLLSIALAGHGFCGRLDFYLFGAGLLITASSVGTFFLALQRMDERFDQVWVAVDALLLAAGTAWLWSMVWTWVSSSRETGARRPLLDSPLLLVNSLLGTVLFGIVLLVALCGIVSRAENALAHWTREVGSIQGWIAFGLTVGGSALLSWYRRASLPLHWFGVLGLATVGTMSTSFALFSMNDAFIALMFGSSAFACVWVLATRNLDPTHAPRWESVGYSVAAVVLAILLGTRALFVNEHRLWSAAAMVLGGSAFALLGYQHKREVWATLTTLVMLLAGTILGLHFDPDNPQRALCVMQTAIAVLGAMSLLRLALPRWIDQPNTAPQTTHLDTQITWGIFANLLLLFGAFHVLFTEPRHPHHLLDFRGESVAYLLISGWLALLTNASAALWQVCRVRSRMLVHVVGIVGFLVGVELALSVGLLHGQDWLAHHVLTLAWTVLAMLLLASSWWRGWFPEPATRLWVTVCCGFVILFALRAAWADPTQPYWPIANTLAISVLMGAMAVWMRTSTYVYVSGLLLNVIGGLIWAAHRPQLAMDQWLSTFAFAQILSFGIASIVWSLIERALPTRENEGDSPFPFTQLALQVGVHLLALVVVVANILHLAGQTVHLASMLAWVSVGVIALATVLDGIRPLFRKNLRYPLYVCGLTSLGLLLHGWQLPLADWCLALMLLLAGYVLLVVLIARLISAKQWLETWFGSTDSSQPQWFWHTQLLCIGIVLALSLGITLTYPVWPQRLCGAVAVALVAFAALMLTDLWPHLYPSETTTWGVSHRLLPYYLVLTLALVAAIELVWGQIGFEVPVLWMQRTSAAFTLIVVALLFFRLVIPRWSDGWPWGEACAKSSAVLGVVAVALLVVFLGEQLVAYDGREGVRRTPQLLALTIPSSLAILGLIGLALWSTLSNRADPYGVEGKRRSIYVYVMELLAVALLAHLRLNIPKLLPPVLGRYWYLSVMVLAFAAVALGEVLARRRLPALAVPLKRSTFVLAFVPVLAFRFAAVIVFPQPLLDAIPGLVPFVEYLERMSSHYHMEALCWLLLGIFFGWQARLRNTANYGIAGLFAVNLGVWVLLGNQNATRFLEHPQLWLIPLGLIVLVAEYVNRDQLGFWPSLSVRYAGLMCIYLSSTIEMFLEQLSPLFAVVLAVVAVAGMLLGILLRVRAFLFAGFVALLVVVFGQIWHAAVVREHNWVWWASGIVLGDLILAMFAIFEKHKNEVLTALDRMKSWD